MDKNSKDPHFIKTVTVYYKKHGRHNLAWRKKATAYRILVSEIMLQQTQVTRVLPKFENWMKKYTTLSSLRNSSLKDVLVVWQGLGYQRRAKALYDISQLHSTLPKSFEALCNLPGIGKYTASAIMAFAHASFSYPLLETNIRTALIEHFHKKSESVNDKDLYFDLQRLEKNKEVMKIGVRHWYYALMDYGAHLKHTRISHNTKSLHYRAQPPYKGSSRELRAKILFAITHGSAIPADIRAVEILGALIKEGYISKKGKGFVIS